MPLDREAASRAANALPDLPHDDEGPVFREPWEARAFAVGVQWHPEYWVKSDSVSQQVFKAFGDAARLHAAARTGTRAAAEGALSVS